MKPTTPDEPTEASWRDVVRRSFQTAQEHAITSAEAEEVADAGRQSLHLATTALGVVSSAPDARFEGATAGQWARAALEEYAPLLVRYWTALDEDSDDPVAVEAAMVGDDARAAATAFAPLLSHLADTALGAYDLILPRRGDALPVCLRHVGAYAAQWAIAPRDLLDAVCLYDAVVHVILRQPAIAERLSASLLQFLDQADFDFGQFRHAVVVDPDAPSDPDRMVVPDFDALVRAFGSDAQRTPAGRIVALTAVIRGVAGHVVDEVGSAGVRSAAEALRRRELSAAEGLVTSVLGANRDRTSEVLGRRFVETVRAATEREDILPRLWSEPSALPTADELRAPESWVARMRS